MTSLIETKTTTLLRKNTSLRLSNDYYVLVRSNLQEKEIPSGSVKGNMKSYMKNHWERS